MIKKQLVMYLNLTLSVCLSYDYSSIDSCDRNFEGRGYPSRWSVQKA